MLPLVVSKQADVSEVRIVCIVRAMSVAMMINFYQITRRNVSEDNHLFLATVRTRNLTPCVLMFLNIFLCFPSLHLLLSVISNSQLFLLLPLVSFPVGSVRTHLPLCIMVSKYLRTANSSLPVRNGKIQFVKVICACKTHALYPFKSEWR
jgi:hypothetical protein